MHVFHVHRYSLLKALGLRRSVRSATFTVAGYDWAVRLYPSGAGASPQQHASISLDLLSVPAMSAAVAEAWVVFSLALVDQTTPGQTRSLLPGGAAKKLQTFRVEKGEGCRALEEEVLCIFHDAGTARAVSLQGLQDVLVHQVASCREAVVAEQPGKELDFGGDFGGPNHSGVTVLFAVRPQDLVSNAR
ncbi:hypothetical protein EJB05_09993, partial [Eragrostis curvula]